MHAARCALRPAGPQPASTAHRYRIMDSGRRHHPLHKIPTQCLNCHAIARAQAPITSHRAEPPAPCAAHISSWPHPPLQRKTHAPLQHKTAHPHAPAHNPTPDAQSPSCCHLGRPCTHKHKALHPRLVVGPRPLTQNSQLPMSTATAARLNIPGLWIACRVGAPYDRATAHIYLDSIYVPPQWMLEQSHISTPPKKHEQEHMIQHAQTPS